jgi:hypothetical protein
MKAAVVIVLAALSLGACGKIAEREARWKQLPGYQEASALCSQCHAMPSPDQFLPAAWPSVIARMDQHMRMTNRPLPDQKTHDLIVSYFQVAAQQ